MKLSSEDLNTAREQLYKTIVDYFVDRNGVEALYIQGSVAENLVDEWSDIDFRVVIKPEFYRQYIDERFSAPKQWGDWIYNEWAGRSWICVSHFKPFNTIDLLYLKSNELKSSPWFKLSTQVIKIHEQLLLERNYQQDLEWIDSIAKLCIN